MYYHEAAQTLQSLRRNIAAHYRSSPLADRHHLTGTIRLVTVSIKVTT